MEKPQLRRQLQDSLLAISQEQRAAKSRAACQHLICTPEFQHCSVMMIYLSMPHEVDTSEAILHAWQQDIAVVVPKISWEQRHMIAVQIHSLETGLSTSASGLRNPITGDPMPMEEIDLVVTPGLGFDNEGNRLGRGGGYYDRFFSHEGMTAPKCGFGFSEQVVGSVPVTELDVPMDFLVTDQGTVYFDNQEGV